MFFLQVLPAWQSKVERSEFLLHPGQALAFGILFTRTALRRLAAGSKIAPGAICARSVNGKLRAAAEGIQQTPLFGGLEQRVMRMLAVNINQKFAGFFQLLGRCRATIDEGARSTGGFNYAAHQHHIVITGEVVFVQPSR